MSCFGWLRGVRQPLNLALEVQFYQHRISPDKHIIQSKHGIVASSMAASIASFIFPFLIPSELRVYPGLEALDAS
jgi:hypothetical protein